MYFHTCFLLLFTLFACSIASAQSAISELSAFHRSGQTFITWNESEGDAGYHVYRHSVPITNANLDAATRLTKKWGPLGADTSVNTHARSPVPVTYVIKDLGNPLSQSTGLFVHTAGETGKAFYAITTVTAGKELRDIVPGVNSLADGVSESVSAPTPVLTASLNGGSGLVYTQFMDYSNWNPTLNGYAYNYSLALPTGYTKSRSYPLSVSLHAYGEDYPVKEEAEYGWQVIQLFPSDPGYNQGTVHSWWFGYAADHNYKTDGAIPSQGRVENFTEQRVMQTISEVIRNPDINVNPQLVHLYGHSMGASGSLSIGMRYGDSIAGAYSSEPMTNYKSSPLFQEELERLWGRQSDNLPVYNSGPNSSVIQRYNGVGVWDWMNHQEQLSKRRGDKMAFLMIAQGKADEVIDWETQGAPLAQALNDAKVGFSARFQAGAGHAWLGFTGVVHSLFGFGYDAEFPWRYPLQMSFPAIQNASGGGSLTPGLQVHDEYNLNIEWATRYTEFAPPVLDEPRRYEISLRSTEGVQTADITPRNTQRFKVQAGVQCQWTTTSNNERRKLGKGVVAADRDSLITVKNVAIHTDKGTLLSISCP